MDSKKNNSGIFPLLERMGMVTRKDGVDAVQPEQQPVSPAQPAQGFASAMARAQSVQTQPAVQEQGDTDPIRRLLRERDAAKTPQAVAPSFGEMMDELPLQEPASYQQPYSQPTAPASRPMATPTQSAPVQSDYSSMQGQSPKDYNTAQAAIDLDRYMEVEELYTAFSFPLSGTDTVYIIEEYMKTLPDTLPIELKKQIILKIIDASNFVFDNLVKDGKNRITELNNYAFDFSKRTDSIVAQCNSEILKLEEYITNLKNVIADRQNLHKKQFLAIENEVQRLKKTIDVVTK